MIPWALLSCAKTPEPIGGDGVLKDTSTTSPIDSSAPKTDCVLPLLSGGLDEDCNGTAAETVPLAVARSLEVRGAFFSELGHSVACSALPVGAFPTSFAAGATDDSNENGDAGWAIVVDPARRGSISIEEADFIVRGSADESDELGTRVVFPGDVDGDGDGELLVTALPSYRPDALTGAAFLFDADEAGWQTPEDARTHFQGEQVQAMLGGATRAGDLDGDGLAEVVLSHTYMNLFDTPGFFAIHRGQDFPRTVLAADAGARIDAVDPFQATGLQMRVGDLDGDGIADLAAGEPNWQDPFSDGRVLVLSGPLLSGPGRTLDEAEITITGPPGNTGEPLTTGDLNRDGQLDLVISAMASESALGPQTGKVFIFFGPLAHGMRVVTEADLVIEGERAYATFASGLAVLDHDGDGFKDLVATTPSDSYLGSERPGLIYVFAGPLSPGSLNPATDAAVVYEDDQMLTSLGYAIDGCDLDGDGDEEIIVGSPLAEYEGAPNAGRVQLIEGGPWRTP